MVSSSGKGHCVTEKLKEYSMRTRRTRNCDFVSGKRDVVNAEWGWYDCSSVCVRHSGDVKMRTWAAFLFLLGMATTAGAGVIWDESVNGNLSTNPDAPTPITFSIGSNIINGSCGNVSAQVRDYVAFNVGPLDTLTAINLLAYAPDNTGFCAINYGTTSVIPNGDTIGFFMAGLHISQADVGSNLLDLFVTRSVTIENLSDPYLVPGDYVFEIQQTSPLIVTYSLEFVLSGPVAVQPSTWGSIKALYR